MSDLLVEGYIEDQSAPRTAVESPSYVNMICNILNFLDASPMTLFEGPPTELPDRDRFYQKNVWSLISCVIAADESIRRLATGVAKRLFANDQVLTTLRALKGLDSPTMKKDFWQLTYAAFHVSPFCFVLSLL